MSSVTVPASIVIVDDDESRLYAKARVLRRAGYEVFEAVTGTEGLALIHRVMPRLAIIDIGLPDADGRQLCAQLNADPASRAIALLQISATFVTGSDTVSSLDSGADASLIEPIEPTMLVATVRALLRAREAEEAMRAALQSEQSARASAEEANRLKDEFLAVLSHELRSPLGAILSWANVLRGGSITAGQVEQGLEAIERNARMQSKLIDELLDVSRIISGTTVLDTSVIELKPILDHVLESVRVAAEAKSIRIEATVHESVGPMIADPLRIQQVIWNLLSNAIKFTPRYGSVRVEIGQRGSEVMIRVSDTGRGIAAEFLPHVFERFRQADSSTTRSEGGLGLGLAIVRHIVELHGGTVQAQSDGPGTGATFTVLIPTPAVHSTSASRRDKGRGVEAFERLDGLRILVVDDEHDALDAIAAVLEKGGARVVPSDSVASALQALGAEKFDAVVSDIGMPVEDGYALIRHMQGIAAATHHKVPSLALTAYAGAIEVDRILRAGFDAALTKPIEAQELLAEVARITSAAGQRAS